MVKDTRAARTVCHGFKSNKSLRVTICKQAPPSNVSEGMRQAADRLSSGAGNVGSALKAPFSSSPSQHRGYRGGSGYGSATVRALRAAPAALAKPLSEGNYI